MSNRRYKIDNVKNYKDTRGWICGHFFPEESILHDENIEVKFDFFEKGAKVGVGVHSHPARDVVLIAKGKIRFYLDGKERILEEGDFV